MKKLKLLLIVVLSVLTLCLALTGCKFVTKTSSQSGGDSSSADAGAPTLQSIQLTGTEGMTFTEGQTLTLDDLKTVKVTATFSEGDPVTFDFSSLQALPAGLTVDKLGATLEKGTLTVTVEYTFGGVAKQATFSVQVEEKEPELPEGTLVLESVPEGATSVTATAKQKDATARFTFDYAEQALIVTAYVTDENIFTESASVFANDGIEIDIDNVVRQKGYTADTLKIVADAAGNVSVVQAEGDTPVLGSPVTAATQLFSLDGKTVAGYKATVTIPYAATAIDKTAFDAAVCVGLNNAENANIAQFVYAGDYGEDYENVHTYAHVTEDGALEENVYLSYGYMWGNGGKFTASAAWNVDGDDGETNVIALTGNDYVDNYIYMTRSNKLNFYAEAKIKVTGVMTMAGGNYDGYPKFGMVVRSASTDNGFGYYVDAVSDGATGIIYDNSTVLGYNSRTNGGWDGGWSNVGSIGNSSSLYTDGYITLGIYRQGGVFVLYYNGAAVKTASCAIAEDELAFLGLFSFNLNLEVKE
ncbi:MAG: hypothetical protein ILP02_00895, partial [Clostridia bacterium]|nr:hypothetical protein [Clostridia bacterium]